MCSNGFDDLRIHFPSQKYQNHYDYKSKSLSWNYPEYPDYLLETLGKLQFEPTLPHTPGVRITVVLTNSSN